MPIELRGYRRGFLLIDLCIYGIALSMCLLAMSLVCSWILHARASLMRDYLLLEADAVCELIAADIREATADYADWVVSKDCDTRHYSFARTTQDRLRCGWYFDSSGCVRRWTQAAGSKRHAILVARDVQSFSLRLHTARPSGVVRRKQVVLVTVQLRMRRQKIIRTIAVRSALMSRCIGREIDV